MMNKCADTPTTSPPAEDKQGSSQQQRLLKEECTATLTQPCNNEDEDKTDKNVSRVDSTVEVPRAKSPSSLNPKQQAQFPSHLLLFPGRLRRLLDDAEAENNQHIISWLPNGKAFKVYDPVAFSEKLLNRYFRQTQFKSFTRQLYHYGFGKVDTVSERGAFYHPRFRRDNIDCCISLDRKTARAHIETVHNRLVRVLTADGVYPKGGRTYYTSFPEKKKPSCGPISTQKLQGLSGNNSHQEERAASTTEEVSIEEAEARALLAYGFLKLKNSSQVVEPTMLESSFTAYSGLKDSGTFTDQPHPRINKNMSCCSAPPPNKEQEHDTKDWFSNIEERFSELDDNSSWVSHTILSAESAPRVQLLEPRSLEAMTLYPDIKLSAATATTPPPFEFS